MIKIFMLSSGRTGTRYVFHLFKNNIKNCISEHEPIPNMYGKPIYWYQEENIDKIRRRFKKRSKKIELYERHNIDVYVETNHFFLKSFCDVAIETFPDIKLIHAIRNPLEVAKSQDNRAIVWIGQPGPIQSINLEPNFLKKITYRGSDGKEYCIWALTGKEKIFQEFDFELTRYQNFLVQWIEIENRAMNFLNKYNKHKDCYTLKVPQDLSNENKIKDMFCFFGLKSKKAEIDFQGDESKSKSPTVVTSEDRKQLQEVIAHIPDYYLKIFQDSPYVQFDWAELVSKI